MTVQRVQIEDPCGEVADGQAAPPRASARGGLRVGVLDNGKPNADRLLAALVAGLTTHGATVGWSTGKGHGRNAATAAADDVLGRLGDETDVVLVGSGD